MSKLFRLIIPMILIVIGIQFTRDYFGNTTKGEREILEQLIAKGQETTGVLKSEFEEKVTSIASIDMTTYNMTYSFKVGDQDYEGTKSFKELPDASEVDVKYLPSDPTVNAANPEAELVSLNEQKGDLTTLLIGLGLILAGAGLGAFRIWRK